MSLEKYGVSDMGYKTGTLNGGTIPIENRNVEFLDSTRSVNNRLVLETYKKEALKSTGTNTGFAMISQKVTVKGLKVLMDAKLSDGTFVAKGSTAYIREEELHTKQWAQKPLECATIPGQFIIVDISQIEFISPPQDPAA